VVHKKYTNNLTKGQKIVRNFDKHKAIMVVVFTGLVDLVLA
jgi:hypothetical protein